MKLFRNLFKAPPPYTGKVDLFYLELPGMRVSMKIYFRENGYLFFDGFDFGSEIDDMFGGDYEYTYTIEPAQVKKISAFYGLNSKDQAGLLQKIKKDFSGAEAYSLFGAFMAANNIRFTKSSWPY